MVKSGVNIFIDEDRLDFMDEPIYNIALGHGVHVGQEVGNMTVRKYISLNLMYRFFKFGYEQTMSVDHLVRMSHTLHLKHRFFPLFQC
jgi:hypothetical protein